MRSAQSSSGLSIVVTAMILLLLAGILIYMSWSSLSPIIFGIKECDYCAPSCTADGAGTRAIQADEFCKSGTWDVSDVGDAIKKKWFGGKEQFRGDGSDGRALMCCTLNDNTAKPPKFYLTKDLRTPTEDIESGENLLKPRVRAYFSEQALPLRNGENIDVVSGQNYDYVIEISNIGDTFGILTTQGEEYKVKENPENKDSKEVAAKFTCRMRLFNNLNDNVLVITDDKVITVGTPQNSEDGPSGVDCKEYFTTDGTTNNKLDSEGLILGIPSNFDGQSLRFELSLTESPSGRVNPEGADVLYRNTFNIINPIQFERYSSSWVREQTLRVSCKGIKCTRFFWATGTCEDSELEFYQTNYSDEGRGFFTVDSGLISGNVGEVDVCVYAETPGKNYTKTTPFSIGIDADAPSVRGTFNPLMMHTNITCTETGQSGCDSQVGYHYIRRAVDFVGAAFTNDDASFCPDDLREYTFIPARQSGSNTVSAIVPYVGGQDFMIMCVIAEDNAGNFDKDIVFNYNSYNILLTVVNSQLEEGGVGTGYHGYNYG